MKFSSGGQYLVVVEQKNFFVYASYTLECLSRIKSPSPFITSLSFNDNDTYFALVSADGFVYRFDLLTFKIKGEGSIDRACDFRSCIFQNYGKEQYKIVTVGSDTQRALFRVFNNDDNEEFTYRDEAETQELRPLKRFSEVIHLSRTQGGNPYENFLVGTETGEI